MNISNRNSLISELNTTDKRGSRGHFIHVSVMMSPDKLKSLKTLGAELQAKGVSNTDVSSIIRIAINRLLDSL